MNLGEAIKTCRKLRGLTQSKLAELSGVSVSHLCLIEKNKRDPSIAMVESISKALKTPLSVLVFIAAENEEIPELKEGQLDSLSTGILELMDGTRKQQSLF
ncbi:MAG: helix-turn-helix domain-containing protein [Candidatus Thiodiazotropha lotti]|jgi:transcriptional regulator with XRE-family HTH domain|nr:helix-turn-helix domain-containing protein [Candidatus Thiodiazotropha lotti]MCW4219797.1 helix-turn-helix domain-containing protein [Candidatus Thiodiazotropha lotti]